MLLRWVCALCTVAVLTPACGSASPALTPPPGPHSGHGAFFEGTLHVTGEYSFDGAFTDRITSRAESCQQYAHALIPATTLWVVPTPQTVAVSGHIVYYTAGVVAGNGTNGFHGPGTYTRTAATIPTFLIDNSAFSEDASTVETIRVAADGSGSMSFSDLVDQEVNATLAGTVNWTCRQ